MRVLFLAISFPPENEGNNLYTDLAEKIAEKHKVTVVVAAEKHKITHTALQTERGMPVLRVRTGNMFNVGKFEKAISYITMQHKIKKAIHHELRNREFDLIIFMAPPVTLAKVAKYTMKKYHAASYLMQKDIFPQNSVDIGMMSKLNPAYFYFRHKEKQLYRTATFIGCMSTGNIQYLRENNKHVNPEKFEYFPNTVSLSKMKPQPSRHNIRKGYGIPDDKVIAVYGGNFGKPQGIDFIIQVLEAYKDNKDVFFILIGRGTEKDRLFNYINTHRIKNAITRDFIPSDEYEDLLKQSDIGLVFLDHRFTIPNIPSRVLSYQQNSLPIMAATDRNTDLRNIIEEREIGLWAESNNLQEYIEKFDRLLYNKKERTRMGLNGRKYLEEELTTDRSAKILETAYRKFKQ